MPFVNKDVIVRTVDGRSVFLVEPLVYIAKDKERIEVPAGSSSDGASTPRFLWRMIPPFGNYYLSAILHDGMYRYTFFRKSKCDRIFYESMLSLGVGKPRAWMIYNGVKWFGIFAFKKCRKDLRELMKKQKEINKLTIEKEKLENEKTEIIADLTIPGGDSKS